MWNGLTVTDLRWQRRSADLLPAAEARIMLPTSDLFVHVYVLVGDALASGAVPGPAPRARTRRS